MALNIPSFTEKRASQLRDAVRILAWDNYKQVNQVKGKDNAYKAYEVFTAEWKKHEIHNLDYDGVVEFAQKLGYEIKDLLAVRSDHYVRRNEMNGTGNKPELAANPANDRFDF